MTKHSAKLEFYLCLLLNPIANFFYGWWSDEYNHFQYGAWEFKSNPYLRI